VSVNGEQPVTVECTPGSGGTFPIGTTQVLCTAIDARRRSASCAFAVDVVAPLPPPPPPPTLEATRFLAFGDSITEGKSGECFRPSGAGAPAFDPFGSFTQAVPPGLNYPTMLEGLLAKMYATQVPVVVNEGLAGEQVTPRETSFRLAAAIGAHTPQVLLLLEGVNDLHAGVAVNAMVGSLRELVRQTRASGVDVFLGTLLPERPGACRAFAPEDIDPANAAIRAMAAAEGATLVDVNAVFAGRLDLLDEDGLHPTVAGYATIAQTYFDAIRTHLERAALEHVR
jgi:lysophospholipase L1-like esterase